MGARRWWAVGLVIVLLAAGLLTWAFRTPPVLVETALAQEGAWEDVVEDDGRTRARERIVVTMPWAGELQRPPIREGQWVPAGEPLFRVRPAAPSLRDERSQAELEARAASAQAAWQRSARQAEAALVAWQRSVLAAARAATLAEEGFVSSAQVETAALDLQRDERSWQAARQAEVAALHDLEQARLASTAWPSRSATGGVGPGTVMAPRDVRVLRVLQPHAATLAAGTPVVEVADVRDPEVVVPLLTQEALGLQPGALVRLQGWAGAGQTQTVDGRVRLVEPAAATKVSALGLEEQRVQVIVDPLQPLPEGDGYSVRAQFVRQRQDKALMVPAGAVFPRPDHPGELAVFVLQGRRARLQPVQAHGRGRVGLGGRIWITDGLEPGREVVVFPPASLADGKTVRAVER